VHLAADEGDEIEEEQGGQHRGDVRNCAARGEGLRLDRAVSAA
jgi:hypothetical protein